ncbi:MAG: acyl carrier protein [Gammaproteobacteria bacterium]|nr:acyl carrier protein [Gammaproteobacteria bacterium]
MKYEEFFSLVAQECATLLNVSISSIDENSNFFHLGGNSVLALQLCATLEQNFPILFSIDGIDITSIVNEPNLGQFVKALLAHPAEPATVVGEL